MVTLDVNGKLGKYQLSLPISINEITNDYIQSVTNHIKVDANYSVVGLVFKEKLSNLVLAASKNKKNSNISVVPIFVKCGKTDSEFINNLHIGDKLIISSSDIMLGYHLSTPTNLLTINNVLDIIDGDRDIYNKVLGIQDMCYFIEFKLVPNCNIHGSYDKASTLENPFIKRIGDADNNTIILPNTKFIV